MIRYLYADQWDHYPPLRSTMFLDRTVQFKDRLGCVVTVNDAGWERDEYDAINPLYVISETKDGRHAGSMRFLPTSGRTMVNEHFSHLSDTQISSPLIWECTRFCLTPDAGAKVAAILSLVGDELLCAFGLTHVLVVFDTRIVRIYNMIGTAPEVIGSEGTDRDKISVGLWSYREQHSQRVLRRAGISSELSEAWFDCSFEPEISLRKAS